MSYLLHIKNASQLVCVSNDLSPFKIKGAMNEVCIIENGSMIIDFDGIIQDIGPTQLLSEKYKDSKFIQEINCEGKSIIPGFVDAHTHACFAGDRIHEFLMKLEGKNYIEIHQAGGGIYFSVNHTRLASEPELLSLLMERLNKMSKLGTTTVEVKSGYGLDLESELKMLRVIEKARKEANIDVVSTFCGAHSVPKGMTDEEATKVIIEEHLPKIEELKKKGDISPEFIDVFCETGVFSRASTLNLLKAGLSLGLSPNFHGDELSFINSATLCDDISVTAISHLEYVDEKGVESLAKNGTKAILLPTSQYTLKLKPPPVRDMIEKGVIVALGSDFSPNSYCYSIPLVLNLACVNNQFRANEALVAATLNSASALKRSKEVGSLEKGKKADFLILNTKKWENIIYQYGENLIESVFKIGKKIL